MTYKYITILEKSTYIPVTEIYSLPFNRIHMKSNDDDKIIIEKWWQWQWYIYTHIYIIFIVITCVTMMYIDIRNNKNSTYIPVTEMTAEVPAAASDLRTSIIEDLLLVS